VVFACGGQLDLTVELSGEVTKLLDNQSDFALFAVIADSVDGVGVSEHEVFNVVVIVDEVDAGLEVASACLSDVSANFEYCFVVIGALNLCERVKSERFNLHSALRIFGVAEYLVDLLSVGLASVALVVVGQKC